MARSSMCTRDRVTRPTQVCRPILLHTGCGLVGHRVQMRVKLGQGAEAIALYDPRGFGASLMVGEAFFRPQPRHPHIDAKLLSVALRVFRANLADSADRRIEQHDINIMVMGLRVELGANLSQRPALHSESTGCHFSQRMATAEQTLAVGRE